MVKNAYETIEKSTDHMEMIDLMQGFRKKFSNDLYMKIRKALIDKKDVYFPNDTKDKKQRIENIANTLYTLASNKPKNFGTM